MKGNSNPHHYYAQQGSGNPFKLGIHLKYSHAICPKPVSFPPILVEKLGKAFTNVPKFVLRQDSKSQNSCHPEFSSPTREISSFISSLDARCQCRQILCFVATLSSRSQIGIDGLSFRF
ncbi:hypothetical protein AVEN_183599-1 [Araneus ventricosus]|uniref:Uncharacterized protein n=1 Tax=Araneus ventricosus TaxID=182803 RepID=A0A4Y2QS50_ARAVE|nr:hypothetical protein AVEN_2729-1 [Araneus ventricosus]GBN66129.1 hypothetical protein AVEN_262985-1 [Araneus ventricosus]GBN66141.1 hypothetical protein AVEN_50221-1 [Araneus ventricosus]GBN66169.1 hypothetical protein AVEN_183599-1 [Araneus ventricosus]